MEPAANTGTLRILLVEDEPTIAITLGDDLQEHGHRVTHVADGSLALRLLADQSFDAVITDLRLPGASGIEVVLSVQRHMPNAAVLLITAYASAELERSMSGCTVLRKPFVNERVLAWLAARCA